MHSNPSLINKIRQAVFSLNPLIHCITNPISITQCANTVLALGGRPIMAEHIAEVEEITSSSNALLLNLGCIQPSRMEAISLSARLAHEKGIPFILDAVGAACSTLRREFAVSLISSFRPTVIKGNYSEIYALVTPSYAASGVDSEKLDVSAVSSAAAQLAAKYHCTVLCSGKEDIISDESTLCLVKNGCEQLSKVTGTGCMLGAVTACFLAANKGAYHAAVSGCAVMGICGELAKTEKGNAAFFNRLLDRLSTIDDRTIEALLNLEEKNEQA